MENIKLYDILVCEDIRTEIGGQHTIVGLVSELNVNVGKDHKGDVVIPLSFMIRLTDLKESIELKDFIVDIYDDNTKVTIEENQRIQKHFNIAIIKQIIKLDESTKLHFEIKATDKNGKIHTISNNYQFIIHLLRNVK